MPPKAMPTRDRLLANLDTLGGPDACWEWMRYRTPLGYGMTNMVVEGRKKTVSAHRAVYMTLRGQELSSDIHLLHSCDNPPCCNPRHLRPGDHLQNMADRKSRGAGYPKGEANHKAVRHLTDADIADIRATYKWHTKGRGAPALGAKYGVSRSVIEDIVNRAGRWKESA